MDNSKNGGNRVENLERREIFSAPESFENLYQEENRRASEDINRGLGETAEVMGEIFGENKNVGEHKDVDNTPEMVMSVEELKPLIADGSTEGKLGKIGVSLVGEGVDTAGISEVVKEIENRPLSEQSAARDSASARLILANFGRMIGNDDIGEIQAEEKNASGINNATGTGDDNDVRGVA